MKRLLLFGHGPFFPEKDVVRSAGILRTLQFQSALSTLCPEYEIVRFLIGGTNMKGFHEPDGGFLISRDSPLLFQKAREFVRETKGEVAIGVNLFPSFVAAQVLSKNIPFWADLNGWVMAEMEAQSAELDHNDYLLQGWGQEKTALLRADQISTVSTPQMYTVVGELASLAKLTKESFGKDYIHVIPNAAMPLRSDNVDIGRQPLLKDSIIPADAFLISQIGGFNNWSDEETLFHALENVFQKNAHVHFATTGGTIAHIAETPFARFQKRVAASSFAERFHLLGWISPEDLKALYKESDLGIMVDRLCWETLTGARNRLNEMMAEGLPFIATAGSEITADIKRWNCGHIVESGKSAALADAILFLAADPLLRKKYAEKALEVSQTLLTPEKTTTPLIKWLHSSPNREPNQAIEFQKKSAFLQKAQSGYRFWKERGGKAFWKKLYQKIRSSH